MPIHAVNDYHARHGCPCAPPDGHRQPGRPPPRHARRGGDRRAPDGQEHPGAGSRAGRPALPLAGRSRRGGRRAPRSGCAGGRRPAGDPGRGAARARSAARREAGHRPAAPARAVPAHRLGQPAAHAPGLGVAGRPRELPHALADDAARAARARPRRRLGGTARRPRRRVARPARGAAERARGLARAGAPRRLPDPGDPHADGRRSRGLVRRLRAHLPRARPAGPLGRSRRCPTSAA